MRVALEPPLVNLHKQTARFAARLRGSQWIRSEIVIGPNTTSSLKKKRLRSNKKMRLPKYEMRPTFSRVIPQAVCDENAR